ncbi:cupin domain-containing protein [Streptomonospora sp. S1-112]|uniref:Cupin domain-containing protein n=1 Tax=Streptomonospora mangrovi TaxID=2883123 RepID=A0A9X3SIT8_9ACTN|nr:cupin domain-containing protein [Streptomonospora mangrovi]MDA0566654.1 cupin domain-containing protein [Streptomonospora mangrovi]
MHVLTPAPAVTTPNAVMTGLAAPSRGSAELSTWRVRMEAGSAGPEHSIDREQVWTVTSGSMEVTSAGRTETVAAGQAVVLPADTVRRVRAGAEPVEALVAMPVGGRAFVPGSSEARPLPWAE